MSLTSSMLPNTPVKVDIRDLKFFYGDTLAIKGVTLPLFANSGHGLHRTVGLRQVHAAAHPQPHVRPLPAPAGRRARCCSMARTS